MEEIVVLEDKADLSSAENGQFLVFKFGQLLAIHDHLAGGGHIQSADHVQQRGFTTAGGSHDSYKFALFYGKGHTIQGSGNVRLCAIIFFQFSRLQNAHKEHHPFFLINPL